MKEYTIKAIPTMYNGVQFRSRLEATWAAFFDLCGWDWDYEPIDLNGWIPDFVIHGGIDVYVEVKPFTKLEEFRDMDIKIESTDIDGQILLLGVSPLNKDLIDTGEPSIGWTGLNVSKENPYRQDSLFPTDRISDNMANGKYADAVFVKDKLDKYDFCNSHHMFYCSTGIIYDNESPRETCQYDPLPLWKQAKNITQWNKKH